MAYKAVRLNISAPRCGIHWNNDPTEVQLNADANILKNSWVYVRNFKKKWR
jgi:hypothetical protein